MQGVTPVTPSGREEASSLERQAGCEPETVVCFQRFAVIFVPRLLSATIAVETQPTDNTLCSTECDYGFGHQKPTPSSSGGLPFADTVDFAKHKARHH